MFSIGKSMLKFKEEWNKIKSKINPEKDKEEEANEYVNVSFKNFSLHFNSYRQALKADIENCKKCKISPSDRDFIWLFFLGILPYKTPSKWKQIITDQRSEYLKLKKSIINENIEKFIITKRQNNIKNYDEFKNILGQDDFELLNLIKIDVERTYQEVELFSFENIKKILCSVLYVFSKHNKDVGYKQGMNEICGVFLYVLYKEQQLKPAFINDECSFLFYILHSNNEFLEHDLYLMYSKFMGKGILEFFKYQDSTYKNNSLTSKKIEEKISMTSDEILNYNDSLLKRRIYVVYYKKLAKIDPHLYELLIKQIEPELFLIRWYLCAFTREFTIHQVVYLWDLILLYEFVETKLYNSKLVYHYNFMDYIVLSMLSTCRLNMMKKEDLSELLSSVLHYPNNISIEKISQKALDIYSEENPDIFI